MENSSAVDAALDRWVDQRLAILDPDETWQPHVSSALARLQERRDEERLSGRKWAIALAVIAAAAVLCLLSLPHSRSAVLLWGHRAFAPAADMASVSAAAVKTVKNGQTPPDFTLQSANGDTIRLSAYRGQVVLLNFWATWCGGCKLEIPWFIEFQNTYGNRGFAVVGVSLDDGGWKVLRPFLTQKKVNYPVVLGNDELAKRYAIESLPMTVIIDRNGKIVATRVGDVDKTAYEGYQNEIIRLLGK
jgi:peroxiredoxin